MITWAAIFIAGWIIGVIAAILFINWVFYQTFRPW